MFKKIFKTQFGFTLVELMIVVNIIGILSVIAVQSGLTYMQRATQKGAGDSLRVLRQALTMYNLDYSEYPSSMVTAEETGTVVISASTVTWTRGVNTTPTVYGYIRRIPLNMMNGEDQDYPLNTFIAFEDAPDTSFTFDTGVNNVNFDGWHYYYKINGEIVGKLYVPRKGSDQQGKPYSEW